MTIHRLHRRLSLTTDKFSAGASRFEFRNILADRRISGRVRARLAENRVFRYHAQMLILVLTIGINYYECNRVCVSRKAARFRRTIRPMKRPSLKHRRRLIEGNNKVK